MIQKPEAKKIADSIQPLHDEDGYRQKYQENKEIVMYAIYINIANQKKYMPVGFAFEKSTMEKKVIYVEMESKTLYVRPAIEWFKINNEGKPLHVETRLV